MIHDSVIIHSSAKIDCKSISIGEGSVINANCIIEGTNVEIGRHFWMDTNSIIGGGSCHDPMAFLKAGDFFHMGKNSQVNIARGVTIGDEVGLGIQTQVFTHGAYLNELNGFPVGFSQVIIGSRVWMPNAWVNPGITIGDDVVIAAQSLVNKSIPSGCLAAGIPVKIIKENIYPTSLTENEKYLILDHIIGECNQILNTDKITRYDYSIVADTTVFHCDTYSITGTFSKIAGVVRNQLRRHGIRFRYSIKNNEYISWD
jgi:acetyltransferase-like isoleucine patch superfamily enzyme